MSQYPIRILLIEDHAMMRHGLHLILEKMPDIQEVMEVDSCRSALDLMADAPPDLVISDAHMPEIDGIEATRRILERHPALKVIILSGDSRATLILEALGAGAVGYVIKENTSEEIERAVQAVMAGKGYLSPEVAASIARYCREHSEASEVEKPPLSERELRLLQLIAQGKRNKEMAVLLNVRTKSIEAYRSRLMAKTGCASPADLTRFAIREGIASP